MHVLPSSQSLVLFLFLFLFRFHISCRWFYHFFIYIYYIHLHFGTLCLWICTWKNGIVIEKNAIIIRTITITVVYMMYTFLWFFLRYASTHFRNSWDFIKKNWRKCNVPFRLSKFIQAMTKENSIIFRHSAKITYLEIHRCRSTTHPKKEKRNRSTHKCETR